MTTQKKDSIGALCGPEMDAFREQHKTARLWLPRLTTLTHHSALHVCFYLCVIFWGLRTTSPKDLLRYFPFLEARSQRRYLPRECRRCVDMHWNTDWTFLSIFFYVEHNALVHLLLVPTFVYIHIRMHKNSHSHILRAYILFPCGALALELSFLCSSAQCRCMLGWFVNVQALVGDFNMQQIDLLPAKWMWVHGFGPYPYVC